MSTPETGDAKIAADAVRDAQQQLALRAAEEEQLSLLDPVGPEDVLEAREALGPNAGNLSVLAEARARKRGRPAGARNKRTDDFARYILGFGRHPAITLMELQATAPEVLIENSKREKIHSFTKHGQPNKVTETMTYEAAQALRVRCAEALMPYLESKRPVAIDMSFSGVADLIIAGVTHGQDEIDGMIEAEFDEYRPDDDQEAAA